MASKAKNTIYLVQVGSELKSFNNWPACQAFVSGKPYKFAGGPTREAALAKLRGGGKPASKDRGAGKAPYKRPADAPRNTIYLVELPDGTIKDFSTWSACKAFTEGKGYALAGGVDREAAMAKLEATRDKQYAMHTSKTKAVAAKPTAGLTSDAGTHGNPGPCEYQVTDIRGKVLAHKHLGVHTNNYAELAGIEAMVREAIARKETQLWTDSKIALGWIKSRKLGPTVKEPELIMDLIGRINTLLRAHPELRLLKWETRHWGQIPSDFGRK